MSRVRVKICGITRPEDALSAAMAGADAVGLVFVDSSRRRVDVETARAIVDILPPFITRVGLFVNTPREVIDSTIEKVGLDLLQFHGDEEQEDCLGYGLPFIKAIRMKEGIDLAREADRYDRSCGLLVDTWVEGMAGGTGQTFDWSLIPANLRKPVILAGGLDAMNVYDAIVRVRPYAVDVSGGVESLPGIKDPIRITRFIERVSEVTDE